MAFVQDVVNGKATIYDINDYIHEWHNDVSEDDTPLSVYLGFTWEEYQLWVRDSSKLQSIINKYKKK